MNIGLYQSASALSALERWQDAVAQNITSSQVTGFKRRAVQLGAVEVGEITPRGGGRSGSGTAEAVLYPQSRYSIVHLPGEVTPTKRDLDVAIAGDGFFTVRLPDDSIGYTRAGEFSLTPDRTLVNNQGLPILSEGGTTIQLQAQGGPPVINSDGTVRQGDAVLGRLGIAVAGAPDKLINLPGGVFRGEEDAQITPMADPVVQQGYLESSNVKPLTEMIDLVSISRAYEANQRLIQGRDRLLERTLEALG